MYEIKEIIASDGYQLKYYLWNNQGNKGVVFYIPGYMSHTLWQEPQLEALSSIGYKVVGMDRRGGGINQNNAGDAPSIKQLLDDHEIIVTREGNTNGNHIWGWCLGGVIAINFVFHTRNVIDSLVLSAPSIFPQTHLIERATKMGAHPEDDSVGIDLPLAIQENDFTTGPALEGFILKDELRTKKITYRFYQIQKKMCQYAWMKIQGERLKIPTVLILAKKDVIVDNQLTQQIFLSLENCKTVFVDTEHGIHFENPKALLDIVFYWLAEHQTSEFCND